MMKKAGTARVAYPAKLANNRKSHISSKLELEIETWIGGAKTDFTRIKK